MKYTKKENKPFATLVMEDYTGSVEVIAWSESYMKYRELLADGNVVKISAKCDKDARTESVRLLIQEVRALKPKQQDQAQEREFITLSLDCQRHSPRDVEVIAMLLGRSPGLMPVRINILTKTGDWIRLKTDEEFSVNADVSLLKDLERWM
jgi:DNA polymerase-3 subunit alpha